MIGLAVDPGLSACGVALIEYDAKGTRPLVVCTVRPFAENDAVGKLDEIARRVRGWVMSYRPAWVAYEDQAGVSVAMAALGRMNQAARRVHEVAGLLRMAAVAYDARCLVIPPMTAKLVAAGSGKASKADVKRAVITQLHVTPRLSEHAADACAVWLAARRVYECQDKAQRSKARLRLVKLDDG